MSKVSLHFLLGQLSRNQQTVHCLCSQQIPIQKAILLQESDKNLEQSATPTAKFAHFYQFLACRTGRPIITLRHHQEKCVYIHISSNYLTTYISGDITIKLLIDKVILTQNLYAISILCEKRLHQGKASQMKVFHNSILFYIV